VTVIVLISGTDVWPCRDAAEQARTDARKAASKKKSAAKKSARKKSTAKKSAAQGSADAADAADDAAGGGGGAEGMQVDSSKAPDARSDQSVRQQQYLPSMRCECGSFPVAS
jgi:hypothetical protein